MYGVFRIFKMFAIDLISLLIFFTLPCLHLRHSSSRLPHRRIFSFFSSPPEKAFCLAEQQRRQRKRKFPVMTIDSFHLFYFLQVDLQHKPNHDYWHYVALPLPAHAQQGVRHHGILVHVIKSPMMLTSAMTLMTYHHLLDVDADNSLHLSLKRSLPWRQRMPFAFPYLVGFDGGVDVVRCCYLRYHFPQHCLDHQYGLVAHAGVVRDESVIDGIVHVRP
mmetsp:Transcript_28515/g.40067  ORF Transcript_28515/g.40067 Transcript_28515/m.40067 type:complete len:219 (-) Transcript_28515:1541-2197(-)